ncbi:MAG TPA: PAS domain S-box protein, partial [Rhodanobacter sp.]
MITKLPPLAEVLDLLPDAVCVVDAEGHLLFVNASFERILGYAPDEVLGRRIFDLVHPDDRAATTQQADQVMAGTLQRHFRNRYVHKDGHSVDIQWSARWL